MTRLRLNCYDPTNPECSYPKQTEFLSINRKGPDTVRSHWVGGRGSAKTTTGILLAIRAAYQWMPGINGVWTEPTYRLCRDVFLAEWRRLVPRDLYEYRSSENVIYCSSGSQIFIRSRNVDNSQREVIKGTNLGWAIEDEAAYKFDPEKYWDVDAAIRIDTPYRFHDTLSTPKFNNYYNLIHDESGNVKSGHNLVHATSFDNPFLPDNFAQNLSENIESQKYRDQEIEGLWVSLSGLIWDKWSDEEWPNGNISNHRHDLNRPYYLFFDLGSATSAWTVVQPVAPMYLGRVCPNYSLTDNIWVATGEFTPSREEGGHVDRILPQIIEQYDTQVAWAVCGHDANRRSDSTGVTSQSIIRNHLGTVPMHMIGAAGDYRSDKETQGRQFAALILDTNGRRRFCLSRDFYRANPKSNRGIPELVKQDAWPTMDSGKTHAHIYPKDGRLEHMRDALFYGSVAVMNPPTLGFNQATAA